MPAMLLMHTMRPPPCARICGSTARVTLSVPNTFSSSWACESRVSVSSAAPDMPKPALLTRMSIRPSRLMTSSIAARTCASSVTSAVICTMPSAGFSRRDSSYTVQPASRSAAAVQRPMPPLPPVTIAIFFIFWPPGSDLKNIFIPCVYYRSPAALKRAGNI